MCGENKISRIKLHESIALILAEVSLIILNRKRIKISLLCDLSSYLPIPYQDFILFACFTQNPAA